MASSIQYQGASGSDITDDASLQSSSDSSVSAASESSGNGVEPIAIVGMGCRLPGDISSPTDLWDFIMAKRTAHTLRVPASRFDVDAYYHQNNERPGSFNIPGGCFLTGSTQEFDPVLFAISPVEALWMDPQQRRLLEVVYETFESAGIPLDKISGSETGCFVGNFTADYQQMLFKEPDFRHSYSATGVDPGIVSNRISNVFNLRGPSAVINTACSSSLYALHNACNAIRNNECSGAIVGGVNLILSVDQHMNSAKLGVLSPTSMCHTFDESADGYSRSEGIGALYVKRLDDALRDGDPVRAIIRSSAVNCNGKVPGIGFTSPSVEGQSQVILAAYRSAALDPDLTTYVECHGTGTQVGDPVEAEAISRVMGKKRTLDNPILIGSIKPNIGHSEASSSMSTIIKAVLALEKRIIPPTAGVSVRNPKIQWDDWKVKAVTEPTNFSSSLSVHRIGVSAFGYGGTNSHCILECAPTLTAKLGFNKTRHNSSLNVGDNGPNVVEDRPHLLVFSAHDGATLKRNIDAYSKIRGEVNLTDLAYTLSTRRTKLLYRAFVVCQGAQWRGMALKLFDLYPSFTQSIKQLDRSLGLLKDAPSWSLEGLLKGTEADDLINDAELSQPLCTAVQIALVNLLAKWNVSPAATVGHSSGEIAASYAAGYISAEYAICVAFYRGKAVCSTTPNGAMLAVGIGDKDVIPYLEKYPGELMIACYNSPKSVTLSGNADTIQNVMTDLKTDNIFAQKLKTGGMAYHSSHMLEAARFYKEYLEGINTMYINQSPQQSKREMMSSVTGLPMDDRAADSTYWIANLVNPVLFAQAVQGMVKSDRALRVFAEIGPHPALSAPISQIYALQEKSRLTYVETLRRYKDDGEQILECAGKLWAQGTSIDMSSVTKLEQFSKDESITEEKGSLVLNLPTYQWTYSGKFWQEPRHSKEIRNQKNTRHDILGRRVLSLNMSSATWRNRLRNRDLPWLKHHSLGGETIFPASGFLLMALEAITELRSESTTAKEISSYTMRNISVRAAMVIPSNDNGVETLFTMQVSHPRSQKPIRVDESWWLFTISSVNDDGSCNEHVKGEVSLNVRKSSAHNRVFSDIYSKHNSGTQWYQKLHDFGFDYGPTFQGMSDIAANGTDHAASANIALRLDSGLMEEESHYILHPGCLDSCLQVIIPSVYAGRLSDVTCGMVFTEVEELTIWVPEESQLAGGFARAHGEISSFEGRSFVSNVTLVAHDKRLLIDAVNVRCNTYEAAIPQHDQIHPKRQPYMQMEWKADIAYPAYLSASNQFSQLQLENLVELFAHKKPGLKILDVDAIMTSKILENDGIFRLTVAADVDNEAEGLRSIASKKGDVRVACVDISTRSSTYASLSEAFDLVVLYGSNHIPFERLLKIRGFLTPGGRMLLVSDSRGRFPNGGPQSSPEVLIDQTIDNFSSTLEKAGFSGIDHVFYNNNAALSIIMSTAVTSRKITSQDKTGRELLLIQRHTAAQLMFTLSDEFKARGQNVHSATLDAVQDQIHGKTVVLLDLEEPLLPNVTSEELKSLQYLAEAADLLVWVSCGGPASGFDPEHAMVLGFARCLTSENSALDFVTLSIASNTTPDDVSSKIINDVVEHRSNELGIKETEYFVDRGVIYISRLVPSTMTNKLIAPDTDHFELVRLEADSTFEGFSNGKSLLFKDDFRAGDPLREGHVGVQIQAIGLGSRASSLLSKSLKLFQFAGIVSKSHSSTSGIAIGDHVMGFCSQGLATYQQIPARLVQSFDKSQDFSSIAILPIPFCTAIYGLNDLAQIQPGETVLIADETGSIYLAAAELCKTVGARSLILTGSATEAAPLISSGFPSDCIIQPDDASLSVRIGRLLEGKGIDVVLACGNVNSTPSLLYDLNQKLAPFPRLVSVGVDDPNDHDWFNDWPDGGSRSRYRFRLHDLFQRKTDVLAGLLQRLTAAKYINHPVLQPDSIYSLDTIDEALQPAQHGLTFGNCVLDYRQDSVIKYAETLPPLRLRPDATYLLVGCLGGLGRSLTDMMVQRGAKHLVFLSRSGASKPLAASLISRLEAQGVEVTILRSDVASKKHIEAIMAHIDPKYPIRGIINAAMILDDRMFHNMTIESWERVIGPKVQGTRNLHEVFCNQKLDFFVMTSSTSGTLGHPGQSNYAAANSYLDALARYRRAQGLPAVSLILPMVLGVGYIAEHHTLEDSVRRQGAYGIDEDELLRAFEVSMVAHSNLKMAPDHFLVGLEPSRLAISASQADPNDVFWLEDPRFQIVKAVMAEINGASKAGPAPGGSIITSIKTAESAADAVTITQQYIVQRLSRLLLIEPSTFELNTRSISSYGLDSMIGAEFRNWIFRKFKTEVPFQHLLAADMSISKFAAELAGKVRS